MRERNPARAGSASRCVLNQCDGILLDVGRSPGAFAGAAWRIGQDPGQVADCVRRSFERWTHQGHHAADGQPGDAFGIFDKRFQPVQPSPRPGRITGHCDHAGVQASEQGLDIFETRRIEQTHTASRFHLDLEPRRQFPGAPIQLGVVQRALFALSVQKVSERNVLRLLNGSLA